jgi:formate hydrogenlyase transcriptional activator
MPNEEPEVAWRMQELAESERRYRLLVRLGQVITSSLDLRQVFHHAAQEVHRLLGCDRVSLILVDPSQGTWRGFAVEFVPSVRDVEIPCQTLNQSAAAWVLRHRRPRVKQRLGEGPGHPLAEDRHLAADGYRAYVYLPLLCREEIIGIWGPATRHADALEQWDLQLLEELSAFFATALDNASAYAQINQLRARLEQENVYLRDELQTEHPLASLVGSSSALEQVRQAVEQVARTDSTVLITGETGTGKELIARAIHEASPRREQLLVKVNCAALGPGVITSELFGHEAGAFTGAAKRRLGRFEVAHRGSIFLDEIAEIPPETQVLLLRVLQDRVFERVGDNQPIAVDVRVIAATNRDLLTAVNEGSFRSDLYYRLNVFPIRVPPLRERREDIPALVHHFITHFNRRMNRQIQGLDCNTLELLTNYHWPGNVRELENIIERAMIVASGTTLQIDPTWLTGPAPPSALADGKARLADVERRTILDALQRSGGKIYGPGGAAEALGLHPTTLYGKMRKHRIRKQSGSLKYE